MSPRTVLPLAACAILLAAPLAWGGPADELAALIKRSTESGSPVMTFFTGARELPDQRLDQATVRRALELAEVPNEGPLAQVLEHTTSITKTGERLQISRSETTDVKLGESGFARLGPEISLEVRGGELATATDEELQLMPGADAGTGFVQVSQVSGVKVSQDGQLFFDMGDLYAFTREATPTINFFAGIGTIGRWTEIQFDATSADPDRLAVVKPQNGLPGLPLREGPHVLHARLATLSEDTSVVVLDTTREPYWRVKVEATGEVGFVHSDHVQRNVPAADPPARAPAINLGAIKRGILDLIPGGDD